MGPVVAHRRSGREPFWRGPPILGAGAGLHWRRVPQLHGRCVRSTNAPRSPPIGRIYPWTCAAHCSCNGPWGFHTSTDNELCINAFADRDFVAETIFFAALHLTHLSRWAEDLIIYSSAQFKFVQCSDAYATGGVLTRGIADLAQPPALPTP